MVLGLHHRKNANKHDQIQQTLSYWAGALVLEERRWEDGWLQGYPKASLARMGGDGEDVVGLFTEVCSGMVRGGSTAETQRLGMEIGRSLFSMRTAQKWSQSP